MVQTSLDIFAHTNPAFGSLVLREFIRGYTSVDSEGAEYPLVFLPLPIILSAEYRKTFEHTNKLTGLPSWVQQNVRELLGLPDAITASAEYSRAALRFGCSYNIFGFSSSGRLIALQRGLRSEPRNRFLVRDDIGSCLSRAERLGAWCGQIGTAIAIYNQLLISL
jgi:hypothetical protein